QQSIGIGVAAVRDIAAWSRGVSAANDNDFATAHHHLGRLELPVMRRAAAFDRLEAAAHAGHPEAVRELAEELAELAAATGMSWGAAAAAHGRALVSTGAAAEAHYAEALALHDADCRPFDKARTQLAYGELLRRSGRRVEARELIRASLHTFEDLSAGPWIDRATRELRASGESARKRDASTALDLTPQELQVVRLVRQGLPNRDVAARLFVSPRTVEYHLSHAYQKLGVRSRGELATLALA
ncbi:MAG: helix-turn-helix transcriptional regulator, partial [Nocardioides sp.]